MELNPVEKLKKDLRQAASTLSVKEARFLVDSYYQIQEYRKASANQILSLNESGEPHAVIEWAFTNMNTLETEIKKALGVFSQSLAVGRWAETLVGIGPVLSAGLLAHIDIQRAPTAGHIWRFAGLDPTVKWGRGQKRPWNAQLKTLCWKIGQSFLKFSGHKDCYYGHILVERKQLEVDRNEAGKFAEQAALTLLEKKITEKKTRATYEAGKLPAGRLEARAERYATKLFLSHWHWVQFEVEYGQAPPRPYVIEHLGHAELLTPPNWPMSE